MFARRTSLTQSVLSAVDLAVDFATLGEYGLEPLPADGPCRERRGREIAWEAFTAARPRGACEPVADTRERVPLRDAA
jgi:hypothetical protein